MRSARPNELARIKAKIDPILANAHRAASRVESGFVWVNSSSSRFLGTSFDGCKRYGIGREELIDELLSYTQTKSINITL